MFDKICTITTGNKNTQDKIEDGIYPFYVRSSIIERINSYTFDGEAVLTAGDGVGVGKVFHYVKGKIGVHQRVYILSNFKCDGKFTYYYFSSRFYNRVRKMSAKNSVDSVRHDMIARMSIIHPERKEQQKVAAFLSLIDERIQTQNKIITQLESLMCGLRKKIFKQQIRFKDKDGSEFPKWEVKKIEDVCDIVGGGTPETSKNEYWNGNIQWFTPTEIKANFVSKSERTISQLGLKNSSTKILPKGTILLTTRATIGEVAIALEECTTNQGFQSLVVKKGMNSTFLFHWIKENKYELMKRANGSTFPEVSKSEIERIQILIPSLMEQSFIADFFSSINEKIETETKILKEYEAQKQYLLKNMFI